MMNRLLLLGCLMFSFAFGAIAQVGQGAIKGTVGDENGESLPGAAVWIVLKNGERFGTQTDIEGNFVLKPLQPGKYDLHIHYVGFDPMVIKDVEVKPDKVTWVHDTEAMLYQIEYMNETIITICMSLLNYEEPTKIYVHKDALSPRIDSNAPQKSIANFSSEIQCSSIWLR